VDFLFLTELECRRIVLILTYQPAMTLEQAAMYLSNFSKVSGARARTVVVLPNPALPWVAELKAAEEAARQAKAEEEEERKERARKMWARKAADEEEDEEEEEEDGEEEESGNGSHTGNTPDHTHNKIRYDETGQQIFNEFTEYDLAHPHSPDELQSRLLLVSCGEFFYIPGWPTGSEPAAKDSAFVASSFGGSTASLSLSNAHMSTYYYNAKVDYRVDMDLGPRQGASWREGFDASCTEPAFTTPAAPAAAGAGTETRARGLDPVAHLAYADAFIGGFLGMLVRAELQINFRHQELTQQNTTVSFVQGTLPNERMLELARERSVRLQREREKAWPGGLRPPPLRTPKTSTPQMNPGKRRAGLTGTDKRTLFQSPESRQRNTIGSAGEQLTQLSIESWGDRENEENQEYDQSLVKWASAGPMKVLNIVAGRRLLHECVQAGLYAVYESDYDYFESVDSEARAMPRATPCRFFELFD